MKLEEVRRWARRGGISAARFRRVYEGALLHTTSRVLQAIYRESGIARLSDGILQLGTLRFPATSLPFRRLEVTSIPFKAVPSLLTALHRSLKGTVFGRHFAALRADFQNSVANVVLNRLLGAGGRAIEPAYQGHQYWPLPALRVGPSLRQVLACSHLTRKPVVLPLLELDDCRLVSSRYGSYPAFLRAWSGLKDAETLMPVHPWQLELSPVVRDLLFRKEAFLSKKRLQIIPLASQRTCRILATGYDVKLPVDATLTGERGDQRRILAVQAVEQAVLAGQRRVDRQLDVVAGRQDAARALRGEGDDLQPLF